MAHLREAHSMPEPGTADGVHGLFSLAAPIQLKRRGVEAKLVLQAPSSKPPAPDAKLIALLADADRWIDDLAQGRAASVRDLAQQSGRVKGEISRPPPLAFLAPDIIEAILAQQPVELAPRQLKRIETLPHRWADQRRRF